MAHSKQDIKAENFKAIKGDVVNTVDLINLCVDLAYESLIDINEQAQSNEKHMDKYNNIIKPLIEPALHGLENLSEEITNKKITHFEAATLLKAIMISLEQALEETDKINSKKKPSKYLIGVENALKAWGNELSSKFALDKLNQYSTLVKPATDLSSSGIENVVWEGGGVNGVAYCGAIRTLGETKVLDGVKRFAGSSAGGITAMIASLGYDAEKMSEVILSYEIGALVEKKVGGMDTVGAFGSAIKHAITGAISGKDNPFFINKGILLLKTIQTILEVRLNELFQDPANSGVKQVIDKMLTISASNEFEALMSEHKRLWESKVTLNVHDQRIVDRMKFLHDIIAGKQGIDKLYGEITFAQLDYIAKAIPNSHIKELFVTGTNVTDKNDIRTDIFSASTTPDVQVALAVRATASIPFFFEPVIINNQTYIDGGVLCNFPIHIFDGENYLNDNNRIHLGHKRWVNSQTIGFKVDDPEEIVALRQGGQTPRVETVSWHLAISPFMKGSDFTKEEYQAHLDQQDLEFAKDHDARACLLSTFNNEMTNFGMPSSTKLDLIYGGRSESRDWIESHSKYLQQKQQEANMSLEAQHRGGTRKEQAKQRYKEAQSDLLQPQSATTTTSVTPQSTTTTTASATSQSPKASTPSAVSPSPTGATTWKSSTATTSSTATLTTPDKKPSSSYQVMLGHRALGQKVTSRKTKEKEYEKEEKPKKQEKMVNKPAPETKTSEVKKDKENDDDEPESRFNPT